MKKATLAVLLALTLVTAGCGFTGDIRSPYGDVSVRPPSQPAPGSGYAK